MTVREKDEERTFLSFKVIGLDFFIMAQLGFV